jgi:hypothetical protein
MNVQTQTRFPRGIWVGCIPCLLVLANLGLGIASTAAIAFSVGRVEEDRRLFLASYRDPEMDEMIIDFTMDYVLNSTEYNDIVFHGDSSCKYGVNAKLFQDQSKLKAYNLGTLGTIGWSGYALLLERYLEHHPRPRMVVFCIYPAMLTEVWSNRNWHEERFVWCYGSESEELRPRHANATCDYTKTGMFAMQGYLLNGSENRTYRSKISGISRVESAELIEKWLAGRGSSQLSGIAKDQRLAQLEDFYIASNACQQIRRMAKLTKDKHVTFAIRLTPVWKGAKVFPADKRIVYEKLRVFETEFDNVTIIRPEVLEYDQMFFDDEAHLNNLGSAKLTGSLADSIKDILAGK